MPFYQWYRFTLRPLQKYLKGCRNTECICIRVFSVLGIIIGFNVFVYENTVWNEYYWNTVHILIFFIFKVIKISFEYKNEFDLQLEAYSLNAQKKCYHSRYWLFFSIFDIFQSVFLPSLIIGIIINVENVALHALFIYALELGIR